MLIKTPLLTFQLLVISLLILIALMVPQLHLTQANPGSTFAADTVHIQALDPSSADHLHSHDDAPPEQVNVKHQHGHNYADHSHSPVYLPASALLIEPKIRFWRSAYQRTYLPPSAYLWQRPPRHFRNA